MQIRKKDLKQLIENYLLTEERVDLTSPKYYDRTDLDWGIANYEKFIAPFDETLYTADGDPIPEDKLNDRQREYTRLHAENEKTLDAFSEQVLKSTNYSHNYQNGMRFSNPEKDEYDYFINFDTRELFIVGRDSRPGAYSFSNALHVDPNKNDRHKRAYEAILKMHTNLDPDSSTWPSIPADVIHPHAINREFFTGESSESDEFQGSRDDAWERMEEVDRQLKETPDYDFDAAVADVKAVWKMITDEHSTFDVGKFDTFKSTKYWRPVLDFLIQKRSDAPGPVQYAFYYNMFNQAWKIHRFPVSGGYKPSRLPFNMWLDALWKNVDRQRSSLDGQGYKNHREAWNWWEEKWLNNRNWVKWGRGREETLEPEDGDLPGQGAYDVQWDHLKGFDVLELKSRDWHNAQGYPV